MPKGQRIWAACMGHPVRREPSQLVVNQREQFMGRGGVSAFGGLKGLREVAHGDSGIAPYVLQRTAEKSDLFQSGIVARSPDYDDRAGRGGTQVDMPHWNDLA